MPLFCACFLKCLFITPMGTQSFPGSSFILLPMTAGPPSLQSKYSRHFIARADHARQIASNQLFSSLADQKAVYDRRHSGTNFAPASLVLLWIPTGHVGPFGKFLLRLWCRIQFNIKCVGKNGETVQLLQHLLSLSAVCAIHAPSSSSVLCSIKWLLTWRELCMLPR